MKTYANKSNAKRAAKKFDDPIVEQLDNGEWAVFEHKQDKADYFKPKPKNGPSTIENPCQVVWSTAEDMKGARRKDIIQACVDKGVAFYTARTQYQLWLTATKNSK